MYNRLDIWHLSKANKYLSLMNLHIVTKANGENFSRNRLPLVSYELNKFVEP